MNIKSICLISLWSLATLSLISIPFLAQSGNAGIEVKEADNSQHPKDRVSFYCGSISDTETGSDIPTTLAYVPQRKASVPVVAWTSNLAAWSPERRCDSVSGKFQDFYKDGRLNYLTNGESAGYPIICALLDKQEQCSGENQLFQIRAGSDPEDVIAGLNGILRGNVKDTVIYQNAEGRTYVDIAGLLENAPTVEADLIAK